MIGVVAGQIVTPTGCAITLTNAGLGPYGLAPMTVVGQTVSVTKVDATTDWGMWSGSPGKAVDWAGYRAIEFNIDVNPAHGSVHLTIVEELMGLSASISYFAHLSQWRISTGSGGIYISGGLSDTPAILIDGATGDVAVAMNGTVVVDKTTTAGYGDFSGLGGMFSSQPAIIKMTAGGLGLGDTAQATARTDGTTYTQTYSAGVKDWCGNAI